MKITQNTLTMREKWTNLPARTKKELESQISSREILPSGSIETSSHESLPFIIFCRQGLMLRLWAKRPLRK